MVAVIKQAVHRCGLSLGELARRSGVSQSQLSRFLRGERTITLESASRLFAVLNLHVVAGPSADEAGPKRRPKAKS